MYWIESKTQNTSLICKFCSETHQDNQDAGKEGVPLKVGLLLLNEVSEVWDHVEQDDKDHRDGTGRKHPPGTSFIFPKGGFQSR